MFNYCLGIGNVLEEYCYYEVYARGYKGVTHCTLMARSPRARESGNYTPTAGKANIWLPRVRGVRKVRAIELA